jgi:hypothetical protein
MLANKITRIVSILILLFKISNRISLEENFPQDIISNTNLTKVFIMSKPVTKVVESKEQGEGRGARVRRSIGSREVSLFPYNLSIHFQINLNNHILA